MAEQSFSFLGKAFSSNGVWFYNVTEAALLGENERGRIREPFLTRRERSSLDRIKSNQNHAARSPFRSRKIQPLHILCHRPASLVQLPSLLFLFSLARYGPRLDRCPVLSIPLPSRENASRSRTGPEDANQIHEVGRGEKKVWIRVARTGTSAEIFFHGFSPRIAF